MGQVQWQAMVEDIGGSVRFVCVLMVILMRNILRSTSSSATACSHMPRSTAAAAVMHAASQRPARSSELTTVAAAFCFSLVGNALVHASAAAFALGCERVRRFSTAGQAATNLLCCVRRVASRHEQRRAQALGGRVRHERCGLQSEVNLQVGGDGSATALDEEQHDVRSGCTNGAVDVAAEGKKRVSRRGAGRAGHHLHMW
jgi:hypothetical protein